MSLIGIIQDDYGAVITITVQEDEAAADISAFTTLETLLCAPNGDTITKVTTFGTDGTDGVLKVVLVAGDLDQRGRWFLQARLSKTGQVLHSNAIAFTVGKSLG